MRPILQQNVLLLPRESHKKMALDYNKSVVSE